MRGLFCPTCRAKNNEEYRVVLKRRRAGLYLLTLTGVATDGLILFLHFCTRIAVPDHRQAYLLGIGAGLAVSGAVGLLRLRRMMADEEKLKELRLKETDERELEVSGLALRAAAKLLLVALYVVLVAAGVLEMAELMYVCFGLIFIFMFGYAMFRKYYETKM